MEDRYLKYKLAVVAILTIVGMTIDYETEVIINSTSPDAPVMASRGDK